MEEEQFLLGERIRSFCRRKWVLTVEPIVFLISLSTGAASVTIQSFYLQRICEFQFRDNQSAVDCRNLSHYPEQEAIVEGIAATYASYQTIIHSAPPIFLAIFWGQLNDRLGSKNLMFIPILGYTLSSVIFLILTLFPATSPAFLLLAIIPVGFSGGAVTLTISIFKLIVHGSTELDRTFRIGMAEAALLIGSPTGLLLGAAVLEWKGFWAVFLIKGILEILTILYTLLFVRDDKPSIGPEESSGEGSSPNSTKIWSLESLKSSVLICFRQGPYRAVMIALVLILSIRSFVITGDTGISFLYTRIKFQWTQLMYSSYKTYDGTIAAVGVLVVSTVFSKFFRIRDSLMGIAIAFTFSIGCLVYAFASQSWMMYLAATIMMCNGMGIIIVRSMVTQIVGSEDVGKALSFIAIPENILPFIATPVYNGIYVATLHSFPGSTYLLSSLLNSIVLLAFVFVFFKYHYRDQPHLPLVFDPDEDDPQDRSAGGESGDNAESTITPEES